MAYKRKAHLLTNEKWIEIRTKYQLGLPVHKLALDYNVSPTTIYTRITQEGWTRQLGEQLTDLKGKIQEIEQNVQNSNLDSTIVQNEISEIIQLQRAVNNYIRGAINLNTMNLKAALAEKDDFKRIIMTNKMKATMVDLVGINQEPIKLNQPSENNPDIVTDDGIQIYLPDNGR